MYIGRFVIIGPDVAAYRVSSRSFPNRHIVNRGDTLTVEPTAEAPATDNPYVEYNCLRVLESPPAVVLGNGSHVDPIAEKRALGYPPRDALVEPLLALDYEKDAYDTPRLAGIVGPESAHIGIVRRDAVIVEAIETPTLVGTYERDQPESFAFEMANAQAAATAAYELEFEHPVCAAGVIREGQDFEIAIENGPEVSDSS